MGKAAASEEVAYYIYGPKVIDSADFGAPQNRQRLYVVALRVDLVDPEEWFWPEATHSRSALVWDQLHGRYWVEHQGRAARPPGGSCASKVNLHVATALGVDRLLESHR